MRIELQVTGALARRLTGREVPPAIDLPDGATVADVLRQLGVPGSVACLTLVNGEDVIGSRALRDGDLVALYPPIQGGRARARHGSAPATARRTS